MFAGSLLIEVRFPAIGFSAANLCVPLSAVALAWMRRHSLRDALERHRLVLAAGLGVYAWTWISAINGVEPALSMRYATKYSAHVITFAALLVFLDRRSTTEAAQRVAYGFLVVLGVLGVVEYCFPESPFFTFFRRQPAAHPRVVSLMIWPNQFAVLMAIAIAWGAALLHRRRIVPIVYYGAAPFLVVALALSGGRGGWLVLIVLFAIMTPARIISVKQAAVTLAAFALALVMFSIPAAQLGLTGVAGRPLVRATVNGTSPPRETLVTRVRLWRSAIAEIERHPISGIGLEVFATRIGPQIVPQYWINTHNLFLNIAVELGLVGAGLAAVFLYVLLRAGNPREWTTTVPLLGVVVGQLFDCFTYDHAFMTFTLFFAASYASLPPEQFASGVAKSPRQSYSN